MKLISHRSAGPQIVRTKDPLNSEPPLDALCRELVTPAELFYIRTHGTVPEIDAAQFLLTITGASGTAVLLSLRDLRSKFEKVSVMAALQCAGNRRCEMIAVNPIPGEVEWGEQAIGNAVWAGARLRDVLVSAGVRHGSAGYVAFLGADKIDKAGKQIGFGASISLEKALHPESILAYEMNGLPLEPVHGFPLRGIIPGYIGARSVKWLTSITVQDRPSDNYYQANSYKVFPPDIGPNTVEWDKGKTLEDVAINSVVCHPHDGASLTAGSLRICGYAMGAGGAPIERVEVSLDGGRSWQYADLIGKSEPWRWNLWESRIELEPRSYEIVVRARDAAGNQQPEDGKSLWNFKGYEWNAWHRIRVIVS
jgi:sulfite oxidase